MELLRLNKFDDERPPAEPGPPSRDDFRACFGMIIFEPKAMCLGWSSCLEVDVSMSVTPGVEGGGRPAASLALTSACRNFIKLTTCVHANKIMCYILFMFRNAT